MKAHLRDEYQFFFHRFQIRLGFLDEPCVSEHNFWQVMKRVVERSVTLQRKSKWETFSRGISSGITTGGQQRDDVMPASFVNVLPWKEAPTHIFVVHPTRILILYSVHESFEAVSYIQNTPNKRVSGGHGQHLSMHLLSKWNIFLSIKPTILK